MYANYFFPLFIIAAIYYYRLRSIEIGEYLKIPLNDRPLLLAMFVMSMLLVSFDGFVEVLTLFKVSVFSEELSGKLSAAIGLFTCLTFSCISIMVSKFYVNKKEITWKNQSIFRSFVVLFFLFLDVLCIKSFF